MELLQAILGETLETLDVIDVRRAMRELIIPGMDSVMLRIADIDKSVVAA